MIIDEKFIRGLEKYYKKYYDANDAAHDLTHIRSVYKEMVYIDKKLGLRLNKYHILLAAYMHDIMCGVSRKHHHTLSGDFVLYTKDKYLNKLTDEERKIIADAVYEHRSSGDGIFSNTLSEVLAAADKGPLKLKSMIIRSYKYHQKDKPDVVDMNIVNEVYNHFQEKFSSNGYATYPEMYMRVYGNRVKELQEEVDNLSKLYIIEVMEDYWNGKDK